jgi:hypothetical protein
MEMIPRGGDEDDARRGIDRRWEAGPKDEPSS